MASSTPVTAASVVAVKQQRGPPPIWMHLMAGTFGGVFGLTIAYPLDTVKVRLQTRTADKYTGMIHCFTTMVREEGVLALYRGLTSPVVGYGLINASAFGSYNWCKGIVRTHGAWNGHQNATWIQDEDRPLTPIELAASGAVAGAFQSFVRAPIEQIKIVMQSRNKPGTTQAAYSGSLACLKDVLKTEGVARGLYRGLPATIGREVPQYALYYPVYELTKRALTPAGHDPAELPVWKTVFAGGLAGTGQWLPTYPIDVIKSRVQSAAPGTYSGMIDCAVKSYRAEGGQVFFRGLSVSLFRAFPLHGMVFLGYETTMKFLRKE